jgi:hypothetical protein
MAAKVSVKKEKGAAVPTNKSCAKCGNTIMSDKLQTVFTLSFTGAKRASRFVHRHKGCE